MCYKNASLNSNMEGGSMAKSIVAIAAEKVLKKNSMNFGFMFRSHAPPDLIFSIPGAPYGMVTLREKGEKQVNPWKLARREPGATGPNGFKDWRVYLGKEGKQIFFASVEESFPQEEGLQSLLKDTPDCILLMEESLCQRFEKACKDAGVEIKIHHFSGELATA